MGPEKLARVTLLLVEGKTEETLYTILLRKLYRAVTIDFEELPLPVSQLVEPVRKRVKTLVVEDPRTYVLIIACGGFEEAKKTLRMLLRRYELTKTLSYTRLCIAVAADLDKNPRESIQGLIASLGLHATASKTTPGGSTITLEVQGHPIEMVVIQQGYTADENPDATSQIEDNLEKLTTNLHPQLAEAITVLQTTLRRKLNTKQKLLIHLALLNQKPKIRSLHQILTELLEEADEKQLQHALNKIVHQLSACLGKTPLETPNPSQQKR